MIELEPFLRDDPTAVALDGTLTDPRHATVSVFDRGFLYGDSVFETLRTYRRTPFKLHEHVERLAWSAERLGIAMPLGVAELVAEVERNLRDAHTIDARLADCDLSARIMLTRGVGPFGLDPAGANQPLRVTFIRKVRQPPPGSYANGVATLSVRTYRPSDAAGGAKVGNYLESILALKRAHAANAYEALIVNHLGHVLEGTTSNVFIIKDGALITPSLEHSILPGVTRGLVLDAARDLELPVLEEPLTPEDIAGADEAFITSTLREILPVSSHDGYPIGSACPGPITLRLHARLRAREKLDD
ncbi:MAG: aminotransferase class IV [Polyangiaceae bacterium]